MLWVLIPACAGLAIRHVSAIQTGTNLDYTFDAVLWGFIEGWLHRMSTAKVRTAAPSILLHRR